MALSFQRLSPRIVLIIILLMLGGVLALIEQRGIVTTPGPTPSSGAGTPDYYLEGAQYTHFDASGQPYQILNSPRISHTPTDDITRANAPQVQIIDDQRHVWHASGDNAELGPNSDILTLMGNATLREPNEGWRLESDILHYDRNEAHAWSDQKTHLSQNEQRTSGDRFDAWINDDRMTLDGDVHSHFPPQ